VVSVPRQGEVWWAEAEDKRRPVLVVTRDVAVPSLGWIVVAPLTRTVRGIPTEIPFGREHGLHWECAASFDNLQTIRRSFLTALAAPTAPDRPRAICAALSALANC
jgi:mRNA interferase MazF